MSSDATRKRLSVSLTVGILAVAMATPISAWSQLTDSDASPSVISLRVGEVITTPQRADETVHYQFEAVAGQTYLVEVQQLGLDFIVAMEDPWGVSQLYNSPLKRDESEFVLIEPSATGHYRLSIYSEEYSGTDAAHAIALRALRPLEDREEILAWRLMTRASQSDLEGNPLNAATAVDAYVTAANAWESLLQIRRQAQAIYSVAMLEYWYLSNWDSSAERAATAASLYQNLHDTTLYAKAIYLQGYALAEAARNLDDKKAKASLELMRESYDLLSRMDDRPFELAHIKNNIGYAYHRFGEYHLARSQWESSSQLYADLEEWAFEVQPLNNLAILASQVARERGDLTTAIETLEQLLKLLPDRLQLRKATYLNNLGSLYIDLGEFDEALEVLTTALEIHTSIGDETGQGQSLVSLGSTYANLGELELAKDFFEQALPIAERVNDYDRQETILRYLGNIAYERRNFSSALQQHERALRASSVPANQSRIRTLLARDMRSLNRFDEARVLAVEAYDAAQNAGAPKLAADALLQLGFSQLALNDYNAAQQTLQQALRGYEALGLWAEQADVLNGLALVARQRGDLEAAVLDNQKSLDRLEKSRVRVSDPELRAFFTAQRRRYYETHVDLLMALYAMAGQDADQYLYRALDVIERSKARMMTDLLAETSTNLHGKLDPESANRLDGLYDELAELRHQRDRLVSAGLSGPGMESSLAAIVGEMAEVENSLNVLESQARDQETLTVGTRLTTDEIQRLIEPGSVLLQYVLGEERSYVLLVESAGIRALELADRRTIESAAHNAFEALSTYRSGSASRRNLGELLETLSALVLQPAAALLGEQRLLISPDGALQYIPFGVLPLGKSGISRPLLSTNDIVIVPSMTVLAAQKRRIVKDVPSRTLFALADPVFGADDPRMGSRRQAAPRAHISRPSEFLTRSSPLALQSSAENKLYLERLEATAVEARSLIELVPADDSLLITGFDASVKNVREADLAAYRFLHFATHGLVDSRYPALSALALSQIDRNGETVDGLLRLHDIYDLNLNADLVVLSACDTALGREVAGEGLIGFTQGFLYAGARRLVVSLWQVPDRATAELMAQFYTRMLSDGLPPAEALRRAQLSIASQPRWNSPYFWGAFVLQGST